MGQGRPGVRPGQRVLARVATLTGVPKRQDARPVVLAAILAHGGTDGVEADAGRLRDGVRADLLVDGDGVLDDEAVLGEGDAGRTGDGKHAGEQRAHGYA